MKMQLAKGMPVFHATSRDSALSILTRKLDPTAVNQWGGGEFGPGFYTATTRDGAALYTDPPQVVIEFETTELLHGIAKAPAPNWSQDEELRKCCEDYDFITGLNQTPTLEYKFNHRSYGKLRAVRVHIWHGGGWTSCSVDEALVKLHGTAALNQLA